MHTTPACIGIILDGNRRWAKEKGLPTLEGHRRGYERAVDCVRWVRDRGIKHLVVYAFSTENWNRSSEEVAYLMNIFRAAIAEGFGALAKEGVRIRFVGTRERLAGDLVEMMEKIERESAHNECTFWVCLSYGGRAEIVAAAEKLVEEHAQATEESLRAHMWSAEMPDPDLIIRSGGERRLSGFLTWQSVYSELFFLDPYWPDFTEEALDRVLAEFAERERRHGK